MERGHACPHESITPTANADKNVRAPAKALAFSFGFAPRTLVNPVHAKIFQHHRVLVAAKRVDARA